jgi:hypothetical protein
VSQHARETRCQAASQQSYETQGYHAKGKPLKSIEQPNTLSVDDLRTRLRKSKELGAITCWHCDEHDATDVHHLNAVHHDNEPANLAPYCKRCHNEVHDISDNLTVLSLAARQYDALMKFRIAVGNQCAAYERLQYHPEISLEMLAQLKGLEKQHLKRIRGVLKLEPIYTGYLSKIKGVGPAIAAALVSEIGDPGRFDTISALWSYCGLEVRDGKARRRTKGEKANWNSKLRMVSVGRLVPQFIKLKSHDDCYGRKLYDQYKAFYVERDTGIITLGHIENRARRKVAKVFLSCLWVAWRTIKGMPISEPYAADRLNHTHLVTPSDWAGQDWLEGVQLAMAIDQPLVA